MKKKPAKPPSDLDMILELVETLIASTNQLVELYDEQTKEIAKLKAVVFGQGKSLDVH